ncbi:MAG: serine/threonine protein kinase [Spirochaetes bacterium]|nr:serine/threonine protein kinase [Spirochaetota bacterium]
MADREKFETNGSKSRIGKYVLGVKIAEGGMGAIYKSKHPTLKKDIILKKLTLRASSQIVERFKREAQVMLEFSNDNIVQVYDHFREGTSYYIVMEFIDGISLDKLIEKNRYLPNNIALLLFYETCKALKYAHNRGVIHRDIKPDNVLLSKTGCVKLTDFGIARTENCDEDCLTSAGMTLGTPTYMSPEQIDDSTKVDNRSDIYSMGVMLYVMVTGKSPFPSNLVPQTINAIQKGKYVRPSKLNPKIDPLILKIIKKSMNCKPKRRYKDINAIMQIVEKKIKKYKTQEMINNEIMEFAYKRKGEVKKDIKGSIILTAKKIITAAFFLVLLCAGTAAYLLNEGYQYEYLKNKDYGAFQINLFFSKDYKPAADIYKSVKIMKLENDKFNDVDGIKLKFHEDQENKFSVLRLKKSYLPTGKYRIQINFENQLMQKDFTLNPRIIQTASDGLKNGLKIDVFNKEIAGLPIEMNYSIRDNNIDITKESMLFIKYNNRWIAWDDFKNIKNFNEMFITGKSYLFKATCENYYLRYVRADVAPEQTFLNLQVELDPVPGYLYLKSNRNDLKIMINNAEFFVSETAPGKVEKYTVKTDTYTKYSLNPGIYSIKVFSGKDISSVYQVPVESSKKIRLEVTYNDVNKTIKFDQK